MSKKQIIKLTEGDLHRIIKESVKNILTENDMYGWDNAVEVVVNRLNFSTEQLLSAISDYFSADMFNDFIQDLKKQYDLDYYDEYEE